MIATTTAETAPAQAAAAWPPLTKALLLSRKLWTVFPDIRLSAGWLVTWLSAHCRELHAKSQEVRAIDDPLETAVAEWETLQPEFEAALANETPALARRLRQAHRRLLRAAETTHANTERTATTLTPTLPTSLLPEVLGENR